MDQDVSPDPRQCFCAVRMGTRGSGGGRDMRHRRPMTRDWMACPIAMRKGLPGAKPAAFYNWVLDMIGWEEGDVIDDLFPGTNGLAEVISQRGSKE